MGGMDRGLAVILALAFALPARAAEPDPGPPLDLTLEVEGQAIPVQPGVPFEATIGGRRVAMRLVARPDRQFDRDGLRFRYPAAHAFEADRSDPGVALYTLDGNDNVLVIARFTLPMKPEAAASAMIEQMALRYGKQNVRRRPATLQLGGRAIKGTRLDVALAGERLRQEIFGFSDASGAAIALIVQDSPRPDGSATAETQRVLDLLATTFEWKKR